MFKCKYSYDILLNKKRENILYCAYNCAKICIQKYKDIQWLCNKEFGYLCPQFLNFL